MKDVKIIFIDLDGTLKDSNQKISIRNKKIFEKLADKGVKVVFTTGRSLQYTMSLSKQFETSSYIISSNGAEIYNYAMWLYGIVITIHMDIFSSICILFYNFFDFF